MSQRASYNETTPLMQPAQNAPQGASLKDQLPAVLLTAFLIIIGLGGGLYYLGQDALEQLDAKQKRDIALLKQDTSERIERINNANEALKAQQDATYALLKESIDKTRGTLFMSDEEISKINEQKVQALAAALAEKLPFGTVFPKDPLEAEAQRNKQLDDVATRMAGKIQPLLGEMAKETKLTKEVVAAYSQRISDQISGVLTEELAQKQQLNNSLLETSSIAQESMRVSQEIAALYLSEMKDESALGRILTLPARLVQDTAKGSIINSNERHEAEARIAEDMRRLQQRLDAVKASMPAHQTPTAPSAPDRATPTRPTT